MRGGETWHVFNKFGIKVGSKSEKFLNAGTENWNFNCNDSVSTPLNLHKKVKQPGDFYLQKKLTISVKKFFRSFLLRWWCLYFFRICVWWSFLLWWSEWWKILSQNSFWKESQQEFSSKNQRLGHIRCNTTSPLIKYFALQIDGIFLDSLHMYRMNGWVWY